MKYRAKLRVITSVVSMLTILGIWCALLVVTPITEHPRRLKVYIDPKNGCQYLGDQGAIVPRTDADGKQICHE